MFPVGAANFDKSLVIVLLLAFLTFLLYNHRKIHILEGINDENPYNNTQPRF